MRTVLPTLLTALILSGCASQKRVIFTTQTAAGLDISGAGAVPNKVAFAYNRHELAFVPPKADGTSHSIYGGLDADIHFAIPPDYIIKQVFATGNAATNAANNGVGLPVAAFQATERSRPPSGSPFGGGPRATTLVFFTGTKFGLHISNGREELSPNALLGYRRTEATMIPLLNGDDEVRPVYADLEINSTTTTHTNQVESPRTSITGGVRIRQSFATGKAALIVSSKPSVQQKLREAASVPTEYVDRVVGLLYNLSAASLRDLAQNPAVADADATAEIKKYDPADLYKTDPYFAFDALKIRIRRATTEENLRAWEKAIKARIATEPEGPIQTQRFRN